MRTKTRSWLIAATLGGLAACHAGGRLGPVHGGGGVNSARANAKISAPVAQRDNTDPPKPDPQPQQTQQN